MKRILAALFAASLFATSALAQTPPVPLGPSGSTSSTSGGSGTVTSVSASDGLLSVATPTTTPAISVAGTSGGVPYFNSASTWASSAVLAANSLMIGGGAGVAPSTVTTGANVLTALGAAINASTGLPNVDGAITTGDCLKWGPGVQDAGAACGSGGAVSSVSNSDGTLTISPTTGAVVASIALGHANTWSGQQTFVAPILGVATGTSLALGGATLGSNALAVTGLANFASVGSVTAPTLSVGNATTGFWTVSTTGWGLAVNGVNELDYGITVAGHLTTPANFVAVSVTGTTGVSTGGNYSTSSNTTGYFLGGGNDTILTRHAAANWQLGNADAAAPVAQTLGVQSVVAGNANTAGVNFTEIGSLSNGSGLSGDIIFKTGGTGAGSGVQNSAVTALTIKGATQVVNFAAALASTGSHPTSTFAGGTCAGGTLTGGSTAGTATLTAACASTNTWTLSVMPAVPTGYACAIDDLTTLAGAVRETSTTTTTAVFTFSGTTGATDVIQFNCIGY